MALGLVVLFSALASAGPAAGGALMTIQVLTPFTNVHTPEKPMARRPVSLEGLRPGILENSKPNAQLLMEAWIEGLRDQVQLGELTIGHKPVTTPPSRETLELLEKNCDFVLV